MVFDYIDGGSDDEATLRENSAAFADTDRPADRVYVLQRDAYYGVTRELNNEGFVLRIKAADGEGNRPVIYPAPDQSGDTPGSRWLRLVGDTYLTGIYFLGVSAEQSVNGIPGTINAEGQRLVIENCVFEGGRSRWWEVNAADTKIYVRDSQFRNQVRYDGSSNARTFDYRTVAADTLMIENTSFLNVNGYIIRYDGPVFNAFIFNHNTVFLSNHELHSYSLATQPITYHVTNNLFVNPMAFGEAPPPEGDDREGFVRVDSLDEDIELKEEYYHDDEKFHESDWHTDPNIVLGEDEEEVGIVADGYSDAVSLGEWAESYATELQFDITEVWEDWWEEQHGED